MSEDASPGASPEEKPTWLSRALVTALHDESLSLFGGAAGLRDEGLLESALARPRHLHAYGEPTLAELAAAYCFGVVRNHPFVDGNKRAGLLAARAFLFQNGYGFEPGEAEAVAVIRRLAAGDLSEEKLAVWIEKQAAPR